MNGCAPSVQGSNGSGDVVKENWFEPVAGFGQFGIKAFTTTRLLGSLSTMSDEPAGVVARYRAALCEGSVLALTHLTKDVEPGLVDQLLTLSNEMGSALVPRSKQDVEDFVCGLKLLEPGLVLAAHWRADGELPGTSALADASTYGAVGVI